MSETDPQSIAAEATIEAAYRDGCGAQRTAPEETVERLRAALGTFTPPTARLHCFQPGWMARGDRLWGIAAQLYSLRSARNWGIGDFTDLIALIGRAAASGADFVALNPLHALFAADAKRFSPYYAASREFLNPLYLDVTAMAGFPEAPAARHAVESRGFQRLLATLRDSDLIDYPTVAASKETIFRLIFDGFDALLRRAPTHPAAVAFARFLRLRGEPLQRFAAYQALSCRTDFGTDWRHWPEPYRDPAAPAVADFADREARELRYHCFLQWEADAQLERCADAARCAGMRVGLYLDLAVGTGPGSAEGWAEQSRIVPGFYLGAPPDALNEIGQDWGLSAFNPLAMAADGYAAFRRILGAVMRHAGALRIDHVLGFSRLFLVPAGGKPAEGAYLRQPAEALLRALSDESMAKACIIIGEDLGTIPEGLPALLAAYRLLSYRLLIFTRDGNGRFLSPGEYPPGVLVATGTHDLPTWLGFWSGRDIEVKAKLGLYPDDAAHQRAIAEREADRRALLEAFRNAGVAVGDEPAALSIAAYDFLARSPGQLLTLQLEDLAMELDQVNLPGTSDTYPNWRRKLGRDLDAIFGDQHALALLNAIGAQRPRQSTPSETP